jgi:hypothetical protein
LENYIAVAISKLLKLRDEIVVVNPLDDSSKWCEDKKAKALKQLDSYIDKYADYIDSPRQSREAIDRNSRIERQMRKIEQGIVFPIRVEDIKKVNNYISAIASCMINNVNDKQMMVECVKLLKGMGCEVNRPRLGYAKYTVSFTHGGYAITEYDVTIYKNDRTRNGWSCSVGTAERA